jgi:DNA-binding transcriptional LysR family regulator
MREIGIIARRTLELGSNEGIARAVASGLGVAILPERVLRELILLKQVKPVNNPSDSNLVRPLFLLQLKERPASPLARAFQEILERRLESR